MSALDTRNADTTAWLVKVPVALAAVWKAACDQSMAGVVDDSSAEGAGQLLGRIVTEEGNVSFLELPETMHAEGIPKRFKLQSMPLPPGTGTDSRMHVLSYEAPAGGAAAAAAAAAAAVGSAGGAAAAPPGGGAAAGGGPKDLPKARVDGCVHQRLDMVPMVKDEQGQWVLDSEYLKLVRSRTERAAEKVRVVGSYDGLDLDNQIALKMQKQRLQKDIVERRKATEAAARADNLKRPRLEKEELEEILFRLFERNSAWAFKSLIAETRQPHMHLKAVLEGIATQQKRGPNKDKYELKPEYRPGNKQAAAAAAAAAAAGAGAGAGK
ncbi:hypothetical protein HYH02_010558 [Chlamydomonas schloesseri]|uniref:TFIIF beta subunit HTH domain-containing protein n=1 Tax=Chlamydomonas schloesseri TaxID=2026947 RepID=A0A835W3Y4_9CHLO|nr:hypothetical protein HYH02_010558 [Chlamydomonas schloesseri]|eukprot:KAG2439677.1 hypothetical protein HYH02_010558 [Chlamydomonas schloesseri]